MTTELTASDRFASKPLIDGSAAGDASIRLAQAARANELLDAEQLDALKSTPASDCDRCHRPFNGDRHLVEITGHYVSGSNWELCLLCVGPLLRWLGGQPARPHENQPPYGPEPERRKRHQ